MTARARRMLAALEDGCATRQQIFAHAGGFFLCNNAASDLRRAGIPVEWDRGTDTYSLLDDRHGSGAPNAGPPGTPHPGPPTVAVVEQADGWLALDLEAAAA